MNTTSPKAKRHPKSLTFHSMRAFMRHYFPNAVKLKRGPLAILPRPSVGP